MKKFSYKNKKLIFHTYLVSHNRKSYILLLITETFDHCELIARNVAQKVLLLCPKYWHKTI